MVTAQQRRLAVPSYIAAGSLIVFPIFDQAMQLVSTAKIHDARWRFGASGLLSNLLVLPVAGLMIVFLIATALEHRVFQRVLAALSGLAASVILLGTGLFVLDAVQVRSLMTPAMTISWAVASSTAVIKLIIATIALTWFALAGVRNTKGSKSAQRVGSSRGLVIGGSSNPRSTPVATTEP